MSKAVLKMFSPIDDRADVSRKLMSGHKTAIDTSEDETTLNMIDKLVELWKAVWGKG